MDDVSDNPQGGRDLVQKSPTDLVSATGADLAVAVEPEGLLDRLSTAGFDVMNSVSRH